MFPGAVSWDRSLLFAEATVTGGGTGAICGVAGGWGGTACIGGSTDSDGGPLRCPRANCGLAACGSGLTRADGSVACDGSVVRWPKFGFCALQSATSCPSICGRGLLDPRGRAIHALWARCSLQQAVEGPSATLHKSCLPARCCDFGTGSLARRSALLSSLYGWPRKRQR